MLHSLRRTWGLSLIELLAAVTIVTILASSSYVGYQNYVGDTQLQRARHDLETLANALQTYDRDHPTALYARHGVDDLKGRYIDEIPADPWGSDFVVDPVLRRVISTGPDQQLQTAVPGFFDSPGRTEPHADDLRRPYAEQGVLSFLAGDTLTFIRPDGSGREAIMSGLGAGSTVSQAPDGNRVLVSAGTKITLYTRNADQLFDARELAFGGVIVGGKDARFSPDGLKYAFVAILASGEGVGVGDVTTNVPAMLVTSAVAGVNQPSLVKGNRDVVFGDAGKSVYRASAAEQSSLTTINVAVDGTPETDAAHPSVSADGKLVAYVSDPAGGDVYVRSTSESRKTRIALGRYKEVAFGPTGHLLALTDGSSVMITTARPSSITSGLPMLVVDGLGAISSLSWR